MLSLLYLLIYVTFASAISLIYTYLYNIRQCYLSYIYLFIQDYHKKQYIRFGNKWPQQFINIFIITSIYAKCVNMRNDKCSICCIELIAEYVLDGRLQMKYES